MSQDRTPAQSQLDAVYGLVLDFAHKALAKHGEFFPFGGVMDRQGELRLIAAHTGSEQPPSQKLIDMMRAGLKRARGEYTAVALCYDVRVRSAPDGPARDAICVSLEHMDGLAVDVFEPYEKHGKRIDYGAAYSEPGLPLTFGAIPFS